MPEYTIGSDGSAEADHLDHMTDGRFHDDCRWCLRRRRVGGTGLSPEELASARAWQGQQMQKHHEAIAAWQKERYPSGEGAL